MFVRSYVTLTTKYNKHPPFILIIFYYIYSSVNLYICPTLLLCLVVYVCVCNSNVIRGMARVYIVMSIIGD